MSTKFYIKDNNGIYLSTDGKIRYTLLEGKALYDFLKTENGRSRCFHVDIDENSNKIGIETEPKMITACAAQRERDRYRHKVMTTSACCYRIIYCIGQLQLFTVTAQSGTVFTLVDRFLFRFLIWC